MAAQRGRASILALVLVVGMASSGCLGDDVWREPFVWRMAAEAGEDQDSAQALAAALASLGDQGADEAGAVFDAVDDLPDNVVFQNAKEFLERQSPGSGEALDGTVRVVTSNASEAGVTLVGAAADALAQVTGPLMGTTEPLTFTAPERTVRLRWTLDVLLTGPQPEQQGQNPTPLGAVDVRIVAPNGAVVADYHVDTTRQIIDQVVQGTYGDRSEVRGDWGGEWRAEVFANAEGAWSLAVETYEPEFPDYEWWQVWRAERRLVGG